MAGVGQSARKLTMETDAAVAALSHWALAKPEVDRLRQSEYPGGMAHACELETALYLHLRPELVKMDRIVDEYERRTIPQSWSDLFGDSPVHFVDHYSRNSVSGVAGRSSATTSANRPSTSSWPRWTDSTSPRASW